MSVTSALASEAVLPYMYRIHQNLEAPHLGESEIVETIRREFSRAEIRGRVHPGMRIAVTCGSRGVANIVLILRSVVSCLQEAGAFPFIIPAMGSHGGATAEGQTEILESYGVTEETVGCPIRATMEVVRIGTVYETQPVYIDRYAAESDGIVVVGRIKPHTGFRGRYESGLMKMMVIGLGKQRGAQFCHLNGFSRMAQNIETIGNEILKKAPILFGLGTIENCRDQTMKLAVLTPGEIPEKEPEYLLLAKKQIPRIPFPEVDVLIVDRIGKDISGDGMDPNITGTFCSQYADGGIRAERVVILDLTDSSHGCAIGMGMADFTTRHFFDKIDLDATYPNAITSKMTIQAKIPLILENDRQAIQIGLRTCIGIETRNPRIVRIRDTLHIEEMWISEGLLEAAETNPDVTVISEAEPFRFDDTGRIEDDWD